MPWLHVPGTPDQRDLRGGKAPKTRGMRIRRIPTAPPAPPTPIHLSRAGWQARRSGKTQLQVHLSPHKLIPARVTIDGPVDAAFLEAHDVLCQGARLVREDVLDLAQLVVEAGAPGLGWNVLGTIIHLQIPVNKTAVHQVDEFKPREPRRRKQGEGGGILYSPGAQEEEAGGAPHLDPTALGLGEARGFSLLVARLPKGSSPTGSPLEFWPLVTKFTDLEVQ